MEEKEHGGKQERREGKTGAERTLGFFYLIGDVVW